MENMDIAWCDYNPETKGYIENWVDENAVRFTGLDEGFRAFYEYWAEEDGYIVGDNFWAKVVCERNVPFAVIAFGLHEAKIIVMEMLVAPHKRGQGLGTKLLKELLGSEKILGFPIRKSEAVIFPDNKASQKAFENAGFYLHHIYEDGSAILYTFESSHRIKGSL